MTKELAQRLAASYHDGTRGNTALHWAAAELDVAAVAELVCRGPPTTDAPAPPCAAAVSELRSKLHGRLLQPAYSKEASALLQPTSSKEATSLLQPASSNALLDGGTFTSHAGSTLALSVPWGLEGLELIHAPLVPRELHEGGGSMGSGGHGGGGRLVTWRELPEGRRGEGEGALDPGQLVGWWFMVGWLAGGGLGSNGGVVEFKSNGGIVGWMSSGLCECVRVCVCA